MIIFRKLFSFYDLIMLLMIDTVWTEAMLIIKISSLKIQFVIVAKQTYLKYVINYKSYRRIRHLHCNELHP